MARLLIVGCGLIGGSVALAARRARPGLRIAGVDHPEVLSTPRFAEIFDEGLEVDAPAKVAAAATAADLTVLATPVRAILRDIPRLAPGATIITDCGSTKRAIVEAGASYSQFVPGHPMAGRPSGSLALADGALFDDSQWLLCPEHSSPEALDSVQQFVRDLGAQVVLLSAEDHDQGVALTSHLPQLLASTLTILASAGPGASTRGPAFHSATRVAGGPASIWADILETNADSIALALQQVAHTLEEIAVQLADGDCNDALRLLERAREVRAAKP